MGLAPAVGGYAIKALRAAGIHDVQDIMHDALMNPERMRLLFKMLEPTGSRGDRMLAGALRRSFIATGAAVE